MSGINNDDVRRTVDALEEMIRESSERRRVPVFVATLPPQRQGGSRAGGFEFLPLFNSLFRNIALRRGATVVDVNAQLPLSLIGQDGLHPTEAGYQRLAEIWLEALKARYEQPAQAVLPQEAPAGSRHD